MKPFQGLGGIVVGGATTLLVAQSAWAAPTQVTNVRVNSTASGVDVVLETRAGDRPQVFAVKRGNSWTADVINTQLRLSGNSFRQDNPAPGITAVTVAPLDANSIRVTVTGQNNAPSGQVGTRTANGLTLNVNRNGGDTAAAPAPTTPPANTPAPAPSPVAQASPAPSPQPSPAPQASPAPSPQTPPPLVPNPEINITGGTEAPVSPAPPLLPRAVPPPVGDISVSQADTAIPTIDLGTAERVPRLVLREASAREVLSLLARAAGLNVAYVDSAAGDTQGQPGAQPQPQPGTPGAAADAGPKVSLDIENESVQDVFNYVIRITGLEANRVGRTIFVGPRLPDDARNILSRSLRMNQVTATAAANFLVAQGAELQQPINRVTFVPITPPPNPTLSRVEEPDIKVIRAQRGLGPLPLSGLSVTTDARLNIVTLTGNPRKIELATSLLSQLDARRRQVAINVRVIDVNLLANQRFGASFSFGLGNTRFLSSGGLGFINFGNSIPAQVSIDDGTVGVSPTVPTGEQAGDFSRNFFLQLQALITTGDAKILTDPTLVVQEGQQATINLSQEVISNFEVETQPGDPPTTTVTIEKEDAGLVLEINVDRIDDNGFITLSVNPSVTSIGDQRNINIGTVSNLVALLQTREVSSGLIRVRDNQTLVLAGIIQDSDRANIRKVPILGDIPLLGALFRRTENINQRQEVIVLVTPQVIDDSDRSNFGYNYTPGPEVQRILQQNTTEPGRRSP